MRYYRAYIKYNSNKKKKQLERVLFVQTADTKAPINALLDVIRKIPFGRLIHARQITREEYIAGVSKSNG